MPTSKLLLFKVPDFEPSYHRNIVKTCVALFLVWACAIASIHILPSGYFSS